VMTQFTTLGRGCLGWLAAGTLDQVVQWLQPRRRQIQPITEYSVFSPVSVAGRGMCVGASWADCIIDVTLGERIMADLERWLAQIARQS